jgi:hypothetical protein
MDLADAASLPAEIAAVRDRPRVSLALMQDVPALRERATHRAAGRSYTFASREFGVESGLEPA